MQHKTATLIQSDKSLSRLVPTFTHRVHKAPHPKFHREWFPVKEGWR